MEDALGIEALLQALDDEDDGDPGMVQPFPPGQGHAIPVPDEPGMPGFVPEPLTDDERRVATLLDESDDDAGEVHAPLAEQQQPQVPQVLQEQQQQDLLAELQRLVLSNFALDQWDDLCLRMAVICKRFHFSIRRDGNADTRTKTKRTLLCSRAGAFHCHRPRALPLLLFLIVSS